MAHQAHPELTECHERGMAVRADRPSGISDWTERLKDHLVANVMELLAYGSNTRDPPIAMKIHLLIFNSRDDVYVTNVSVPSCSDVPIEG